MTSPIVTNAIDFGHLAAHVAGALGSIQGYGYGATAAAKSLQHVQDELMKLYESQRNTTPEPTSEVPTPMSQNPASNDAEKRDIEEVASNEQPVDISEAEEGAWQIINSELAKLNFIGKARTDTADTIWEKLRPFIHEAVSVEKIARMTCEPAWERLSPEVQKRKLEMARDAIAAMGLTPIYTERESAPHVSADAVERIVKAAKAIGRHEYFMDDHMAAPEDIQRSCVLDKELTEAKAALAAMQEQKP